MSRTRNQHFIPRFHLAYFTPYRKARLAIFDKRWGKYAIQAVAISARRSEYYNLSGRTDDQRLFLERQFALLENVIAPFFRAMVGFVPGPALLDQETRVILANYIAIQHLRVPAYRDPAQVRAREMAKDPEVLGIADPSRFLMEAREFGMTGTDEQLEARRATMLEELTSGAKAVNVPPTMSLLGLNSAEKVAALLVNRRWELLRWDGWPGYVLGDEPVALLAPGGRTLPSIGFGTPGVQVLMPIAPWMLLVISDAPRERVLQVTLQPDERRLAEPRWAIPNKVAWLTAQRYVFGRARAHLEATELLIPPEFRRVDLRTWSPAAPEPDRDHSNNADKGG